MDNVKLYTKYNTAFNRQQNDLKDTKVFMFFN